MYIVPSIDETLVLNFTDKSPDCHSNHSNIFYIETQNQESKKKISKKFLSYDLTLNIVELFIDDKHYYFYS